MRYRPAGARPDRRDKKGCTALHFASYNNQVSLLKILLKTNTDVNMLDFHGQTPLFVAVKMGNASVIDILIQNGGHPDIRDKKGCTALHFTSYNNQVSVL